MVTIRHASFPADTPGVLDIWNEYVTSPTVSLDYQDYHTEFADLPGKYAHPHGGCSLPNEATSWSAV